MSQPLHYLFIFLIALIIATAGCNSVLVNPSKQELNLVSANSQQSSPKPNPENVYNEIVTFSDWYRYLDTPGHRAAENYIFSKFDSLGLNTSRQEYTCQRQDGSVRGVNVLGLLEGELEPEKWLVVGGHYDANQFDTHGAYDNAAGAGTVLELARFFSEYYKTNDGPNISILFATWDAEEGGGAGSKHFIDNLQSGIAVVANINLDMYSLNYPIKNSIPGATEEYFKLYLLTSPVVDTSGYSGVNFDEATIANFTVFQELLKNITYKKNNYPSEWVPVMDDTKTVSDHSHFIRRSIPAVWFRGMNEYPRDERDLNERNFKHTPVDTIETMERYAGGKSELLKGINTGLTIAYQLVIDVINITSIEDLQIADNADTSSENSIAAQFGSICLVAIIVTVILFGSIYFYKYKRNRK